MVRRFRLGPKMMHAVSLVQAHPGCTKLFVAQQVTRRVVTGYAIVDRAIRAGLIHAELTHGRYALYIPEDSHDRTDARRTDGQGVRHRLA